MDESIKRLSDRSKKKLNSISSIRTKPVDNHLKAFSPNKAFVNQKYFSLRDKFNHELEKNESLRFSLPNKFMDAKELYSKRVVAPPTSIANKLQVNMQNNSTNDFREFLATEKSIFNNSQSHYFHKANYSTEKNSGNAKKNYSMVHQRTKSDSFFYQANYDLQKFQQKTTKSNKQTSSRGAGYIFEGLESQPKTSHWTESKKYTEGNQSSSNGNTEQTLKAGLGVGTAG
jgi:hypothetical protein